MGIEDIVKWTTRLHPDIEFIAVSFPSRHEKGPFKCLSILSTDSDITLIARVSSK